MGKISYPKDHKPGLIVPKGGSCCANCHYLSIAKDGSPHCGQANFIIWNGSTRIPVDDPEEYCSDWYEQKEEDE